MMARLGIKLQEPLTDYELCIASNLVDTSTLLVEWDDIGGLQHIIEEVKEVIILPFTRPDLFCSSELLQPPKGNSDLLIAYNIRIISKLVSF